MTTKDLRKELLECIPDKSQFNEVCSPGPVCAHLTVGYVRQYLGAGGNVLSARASFRRWGRRAEIEERTMSEFTSYREDLNQDLSDSAYADAYLSTAREESQETFLLALQDVVKAKKARIEQQAAEIERLKLMTEVKWGLSTIDNLGQMEARAIEAEKERDVLRQRVEELESAARKAFRRPKEAAEGLRKIIVSVYPDPTRSDSPYYHIRSWMATVLKTIDEESELLAELAAKSV